MIDRHNYEEFFILYWDNELKPEEKPLVEKFVELNPDLAEEFRQLGAFRFDPREEILYPGKESLLQPAGDHVHHETLLSYLDNELEEKDRTLFEEQLHKDPSLREELNNYSLTRLRPDLSIQFPGKESLYRREARTVLMNRPFFRYAVAAALLLVAGYYSFQLIQPAGIEPTGPLAGVEKNVAEPSRPQNSQLPASTPAQQEPAVETNQHNYTGVTGNAPASKSSVNGNRGEAVMLASIDNRDNRNRLPVAQQTNNVQRQEQENTPAHALLIEPVVLERSNQAVRGIRHASNISLDDQVVTDKSTPAFQLYTPDMELAKDNGGLKGLLRKATRVIERHTNIQTTTEDNKLLVGAFSVSLQ